MWRLIRYSPPRDESWQLSVAARRSLRRSFGVRTRMLNAERGDIVDWHGESTMSPFRPPLVAVSHPVVSAIS